MNERDCIFCKIINRELPAIVLYEDNLVIAFMDVMPVNSGHVLIVPKEHNQYLVDVKKNTANRMFEVAIKINEATRKSGIKCEAINFMVSDGKAAGQEVFHCHLHCIPRFKDDGVRFVFPSKSEKMANVDELNSIAETIKRKLEIS